MLVLGEQNWAPMVIGYNGRILTTFSFQMATKIFKVKWTMTLTSHMMPILKLFKVVRHHWMTKCGYSVGILKDDR